MRIPSLGSIINRALDLRGDALHQHDGQTVRGIDTLIKNLYRGAKLKWDLSGNLLVTSVNTPGAVYTVRTNACSCSCFGPCWHGRARDLLEDMRATEADTADMTA